MTVAVMTNFEEIIDEDSRMTESNLRDRLRSDIDVSVSRTSVHCALQGMIYSLKQLRIEKSTMNNATNKDKRKIFVQQLNMHAERGNMISRKQGWSRVGERAQVALPPSQGKNLRVQGGESSGTEVMLLRMHDGSIDMCENARFIADLFVAVHRTEDSNSKVAVVTDNAPTHSRVEISTRQKLASNADRQLSAALP